MTRRKPPHERLKPGPKPGAKLVRAAPAPTAARVESDSTRAQVEARPNDPLQRHRHIGSMGGTELRAYALQVGVSRRDAESLSLDRLRVNCAHVLNALIEEL